MAKFRFLLASVVVVFVAGCLQTRSNLRGQTPSTPTVTPQQQKAAEEAIQKEDANKEFRELYGRIESVEKQLADTKSNEPVKALEAKINQMEIELSLLRTTVSELNAKAKKEAQMQSSDERAGNHPQPKAHFKSPLADATQHFNNKKWEDAILAYEEYRKNNPKGAEYPEATLKIGMCFQNMGLKEDAKVFYKEVADKFPKSQEASVAKSKLKKL